MPLSKLYELTFLKSTNIIIYFDSEGNVFLANDSAKKYFDLPNNELFRLDNLKFTDVNTSTIWDFKKCFSLEIDTSIEVELELLKGGFEHYLMTQITHTIHGNKTFLLITFHDITSNKSIKKNIHERRESLNELISEFPTLLIGINSNETIKVWNKFCEKTTGFSQNEIIGNPDSLSILFPVKEQRDAILLHWNTQNNGTGEDNEFEISCKDGSKKTIAWTIRGKEVASFIGMQILGIGIDVTDEVFARQELLEQQKLQELINKVTHDALWNWDFKTNYLWFNEGLTHLFGHDPNIGNSIIWWEENIHPEDQKRVISKIQLHVNKKIQTWSDEYKLKSKDGSYVYVLDKGQLMFNDAGVPVRMIGGIMDISERKIYEESILIKNKQLQEYAFYNSHKIRGPLTRLMGLIEILKNEERIDVRQEIDTNIINSAHELDRMIKEIAQMLNI